MNSLKEANLEVQVFRLFHHCQGYLGFQEGLDFPVYLSEGKIESQNVNKWNYSFIGFSLFIFIETHRINLYTQNCMSYKIQN